MLYRSFVVKNSAKKQVSLKLGDVLNKDRTENYRPRLLSIF
jgi:hypothetical protein